MTLVKARNLDISYYGSDFEISGVNLSLDSGKRLAVYGREGVGKTALLRALARLEEYRSGEIYLLDKPLRQYSHKDMNFGYTFDSSVLKKNQSVREIVSYPMKLREKSLMQIDAYLDEIRMKYGLSADSKVSELSGESVAALITARLFCVERQVYLVDDFWKDLPKEGKDIAVGRLKAELSGKTAIIAASEPDVIENLACDEIIVLSKGEASAQMSLEQIRLRPTNMESAILCGYKLYVGVLEKLDGCYFANIDGRRYAVEKPFSDVFAGKRVCFALCGEGDSQVKDFYYDLLSERIITGN